MEPRRISWDHELDDQRNVALVNGFSTSMIQSVIRAWAPTTETPPSHSAAQAQAMRRDKVGCLACLPGQWRAE